MGRWVRKTSAERMLELPVVRPELADAKHECQLPDAGDAGARSIWECECGLRWRIAVPHWRPLSSKSPTTPIDLPQWVASIADRYNNDFKAV